MSESGAAEPEPLAERLAREAVRLAGKCDAKLDVVATKRDLARVMRWVCTTQAITIIAVAGVIALLIR